MSTLTLKKQLHKTIDNIEDSVLLEAVYEILNRVPNLHEYNLTTEQQKLVDTRRKLLKEGKLKTISLSDIRKKALQKISA